MLALVGFSLFTPDKALGVARTWDGGCGVDTSWSCAANWSGDTVPAAADTVTFDNTSDNNSTIDALFNATETIGSITINSGYDGTITQSTTIHITTTLTIHAGAYSASNQTLDMNGTFVMDGGGFTASSGSTTLAGAMTISGVPSFSANGGTFTFDGTTGATLSCNNVTFNLVTFTHNNVAKTVSSNCSMPLGNNPSVGGNAGASITLNGSFSGTGTLTTVAGFTVNSTAPYSGFTDITSNVVNISGGNFTAPSGVFTVNSTFTINAAATFDDNSGTVTFASTTAAVLSCGGKTFNLVTFTHLNVAKTVSSDCNLPLGNNPTIGGNLAADLTLAGTISGTGTATIGTGASGNVLTMQTSAAMTGFTGLVTGGLTFSSGTTDLSALSTLTASGAFSQTGGTFTLPSVSAIFSSTATVSSGATITLAAGTTTFNSTTTFSAGSNVNHNSGTVAFGAATSVTITCNGAVFNLVTFTHTGSVTKTISTGCALPLGNNPTVGGDANADIQLASDSSLTGTGNLTIGTAASTNLLTMAGTSTISGFSGLTAGAVTISSTAITDFSSYSTFVINGAYNQSGAGTITVPDGADFNSTLALSAASGAVFNAPAGTMTVANTITLNSGTTFNGNSGILQMDGTASATLNCGGTITFGTVQFTHTANGKTVASGCTVPLGNDPTVGSGSTADFTLAGTLSGTGTLTVAGATSGNALFLQTGAAISGFSGIAAGLVTVSSGTIDLSSINTLTVASTFTVNGGSITLPSTSATFSGVVTVNSGATLTMSAGTSIFTANLVINAGASMNANSGTVELSGSGASIFCDNETFNLVTFTHTSGSWWVRSDCSLPLGSNPVIGNDVSIELDGTLSGSGTFTMSPGTLVLNSAMASLSGFSGININVLTVLDGTVDFSSYTNWTVGTYGQSAGAITLPTAGASFSGDTTILGGTFTASSGTTSFDGGLTIDVASTFDANGGTVDFGGTTNSAIRCGNKTFNLATFTHTSGYKSIFNDCSLPLGANPIAGAGGSINLGNNSPTLSGTGTLTTTGELLMYGTDLSGFSGLHADNLSVYSANLGSYTTLDIDGNFLVYNDFTAPSGNMTIGGNVTFNNGTTFTHNNGTVILDGTNQTINTNGNPTTTFNNLTKIVTSPATLTFPASDSIITVGTLTLKGTDASNLLTLASSTPGGTNWEIDAQGTRDIRYVNVADSTNLDGTSPIIAYDGVDGGGGNINWLFQSSSDPDPDPDPTPDPGGGATPSPGTTITTAPSTSTGTQSSIAVSNQSVESTPEVAVATPEPVKLDSSNSNNGSSIQQTDDQSDGAKTGTKTKWFILLIFIVILLGVFFFFILAKRRKSDEDDTSGPNVISPSGNNPGPDKFIQ